MGGETGAGRSGELVGRRGAAPEGSGAGAAGAGAAAATGAWGEGGGGGSPATVAITMSNVFRI